MNNTKIKVGESYKYQYNTADHIQKGIDGQVVKVIAIGRTRATVIGRGWEDKPCKVPIGNLKTLELKGGEI